MDDIAEAIRLSVPRREGPVGTPVTLKLWIRTCNFFNIIYRRDVGLGMFDQIKSQVYLEVWS